MPAWVCPVPRMEQRPAQLLLLFPGVLSLSLGPAGHLLTPQHTCRSLESSECHPISSLIIPLPVFALRRPQLEHRTQNTALSVCPRHCPRVSPRPSARPSGAQRGLPTALRENCAEFYPSCSGPPMELRMDSGKEHSPQMNLSLRSHLPGGLLRNAAFLLS